MGTFKDAAVREDTHRVGNAQYNRIWRWIAGRCGFHPQTKCITDDTNKKGTETMEKIFKRIVDANGNIDWRKIFHVSNSFSLTAVVIISDSW